MSAGMLFSFLNVRHFWKYGCSGVKECTLTSSMALLPLLVDIHNIVIGIHSAVLINPSTVYKYYPEVIMWPLKNESDKIDMQKVID